MKIYAYAVLMLGAMAAIGAYTYQQRQIGAVEATKTIVQRSEKQGAQNAAKSKKRFDDARQPGAVDRLRSDPAACPDCPR